MLNFISYKCKKLLAFAGITSIWKNHQGERGKTYVTATTQPNELVAPLHNRMSVILQEEGEATWLGVDVIEPERLLLLLRLYLAEGIEA